MLTLLLWTVSISEDPGENPDHCAGFQLCVMEVRLDYMGSSILMGRISDLNLSLADEWQVDRSPTMESQPLATKRLAFPLFFKDDFFTP